MANVPFHSVKVNRQEITINVEDIPNLDMSADEIVIRIQVSPRDRRTRSTSFRVYPTDVGPQF